LFGTIIRDRRKGWIDLAIIIIDLAIPKPRTFQEHSPVVRFSSFMTRLLGFEVSNETGLFNVVIFEI